MLRQSGAPRGQFWPATRPCLPACTSPSSTSMVYTTTGQSAPQVTHRTNPVQIPLQGLPHAKQGEQLGNQFCLPLWTRRQLPYTMHL